MKERKNVERMTEHPNYQGALPTIHLLLENSSSINMVLNNNMNKYSFIKKGATVYWTDPCDEMTANAYRIIEINADEGIEDDTAILIENGATEATVFARELRPILRDFDRGYWCAIQDAVANRLSTRTIAIMLENSGLTYNECCLLMKESDAPQDRIKKIVDSYFPMTLDRYVSESGFAVECLYLKLNGGQQVRGIIIHSRINKYVDTLGKHIYDIRESDDGEGLATIEKNVAANWSCSIALDEPLDIPEDTGLIIIDDYGYESWREAAYGYLYDFLGDNAVDRHLEIGEFITCYWQNLESAKTNVENFKNWLKDV